MEQFIGPLFRGLGEGSVLAIIGLGFVVIYRATDVVNFAQPTMVIIGAFFTSFFVVGLGFPFWAGVAAAMVANGLMAAAIERVALRPMVGKPVFSAAMVTVGVFFALLVLSGRLIPEPTSVGDPWGIQRVDILGAAVRLADLWKIGVVLVAFAAVGIFLAKSRTGLAMRATSLDQETAMAQGIPVGRMFGLAWAISGALAGLGGMLIRAGETVEPTTAFAALAALPAIILGGLDSIKGALLGGLVIGIAQAFTRAYAGTIDPIFGSNISSVVAYVIMILVLMARPYGMFGTPEVRRV